MTMRRAVAEAPTALADAAIAHVPALDGLRGLAIALVLALHFGVGADFPGHINHPIGGWLERAFYVGWSGVDLFFVLSGYLITSILLASRDRPRYFRRFYGRRALRILPLSLTVLGLALLVVPRVLPSEAPLLLRDSAAGQIWLWTYTLNIATTFGWIGDAGILAQMWTLAIEGQFYLVWPWFVRRASHDAIVRVCAGGLAGALTLRLVWVWFDFPGGWLGAYNFTLTRLDPLAVGAAIAVLWRDQEWRARASPCAAAGIQLGLIALLVAFVWLPRVYPDQTVVVTLGHTVVALLSGCLLVRALGPHPPSWMRAPAMMLLGRYSYGIYIWHWPVQRCLLLYLDGQLQPVAFVSLGVALSVGLGVASYHLLEAPFLRLKRVVAYDRQ